jgi:enoyl-CoA hydratase/carnithine racemase
VYEQIRYHVDDPVATITLNRPDAMNAWTNTMAAELRQAIGAAEADPAVVGIIITGAGRGFCAGADLGILSSIASGGSGDGIQGDGAPGGEGGEPDDFDSTYTYLMATTKPIIAAINGAVAGMAVPMVMCCDLRFMAESAAIVSAFSQRGLVAEWGLSWLLPRLVGPAVALDVLFSSRKIHGPEAAALGLVNRCLPDHELLDHCRDYIVHLAEHCSPTSMSIMKRQVYEQLHRGLGAAELESQRLMLESFGRPDFAEGVQSFLTKRPPRFQRLGDL